MLTSFRMFLLDRQAKGMPVYVGRASILEILG